MKKFTISFQLLLILSGLILFSVNSIAQTENIQVGTTTRKMLVYAPSGIEPDRPLLISLHGLNQDIAYQQNQTKWELIAKENNFVVVYPGGINNSWDLSGKTDIDFIVTIIDEMYKRYGIDRDRVYLSGFSMGGMMTYYAAIYLADKIAAFAPVSGYLMGGPNTNSSRPIPIIHTHGTSDDVVAYSGVATCLNAWIKRNNCPSTAVVTQPYPSNKLSSNGTKYYWGPGTDSVEIVLLSLKGNGHWHSIDANGVNTSQEIWNFCKKYSLGYGVPKFKNATINDSDPKQILATFSLPIKSANEFDGFAVKIDGQSAEIDTVILTDSVHLAIKLSNNILNSNEIKISYIKGNVLSTYEKALPTFNDTLVENLLNGASPRLVELSTFPNGDSLKAKFSKKMLIPSDITSLALKAEFNGEKIFSLGQCSFYNNDSTILVFPLSDTVYADYKLSLSYAGSSIVSSDSGSLKNNQNYSVANNSLGLPVHIVSAVIDESAIAISLDFSKPMSMKDFQIKQLVLKINGKDVAIKEIFNLKNTIRLNLSSNLYYGDSIKISYTQGNITASDKGALETFTDFVVQNPIAAPTYLQLPGKVEAENYTMQFGIDTENTSDDGGGLNVGWTDPGDWLVYAIENNTEVADYKILFRLAAQSGGASFAYYLDDVKVAQVSAPVTGAWQKFQYVVKDISIPKGKHYIKLVVVTAGFNINYFEVQKEFVNVSNTTIRHIGIYPNPASDKITIKSDDFKFNKIEIIDIEGRTVLTKSITYQPEMNFPVNLKKGAYVLKLSDSKTYFSQQINIVK